MSALIEDRSSAGFYEGFGFEKPEGLNRIYAVGLTPFEAICAFAHARGIGEVDPSSLQPLDGESKWHWGRRFVADGTSFKAAGQRVPGGVVITWWK